LKNKKLYLTTVVYVNYINVGLSVERITKVYINSASRKVL